MKDLGIIETERIEVQVDNTSGLQLLQGEIGSLDIKLTGIYPLQDQLKSLRFATAELKTNLVSLDKHLLEQGKVIFTEPLSGTVELEITSDDINAFLRSSNFSHLVESFFAKINFHEEKRYELADPKITLLPETRLRAEIVLIAMATDESLTISAETGFAFDQESRLRLVNLKFLANGTEAPQQLVDVFTENLNSKLTSLQEELNSAYLKPFGITLYLSGIDITSNELTLTLWTEMQPTGRSIN